MSVSIAIVANVFQEANALPGWLECHLPFADWVGVMHASPCTQPSDDGTMEILDKWRIPTQFCDIADGFGVVRTKTLRMVPSSIDYIILLDADERFYPLHRHLTCTGIGTPQADVDWILQSYDYRGVNLPNWENIDRLGADLRVGTGYIIDQGRALREWIEEQRPDAVVTSRRHWHDLSFKRPTQDWKVHPDWQMRIVRNSPEICYDPGTRMHERLCGANHVLRALPGMLESQFLYFDHFHFTFKRMEPEQRRHDIAIYDKIHAGERPPTREEMK